MTLDTHWLTYAELADRLEITGESARNLVRRRGWPRKPGNDGAQRVGVPVEYLEERAKEEAIVAPIEVAVVAPVIPPMEVDIEGTMMAALEAHISTLKGVVDHERQRADLERERADGERDRADTLASELAQLRAAGARDVADVEKDVAQLRALVETMRASPAPSVNPWWRRLAGYS